MIRTETFEGIDIRVCGSVVSCWLTLGVLPHVYCVDDCVTNLLLNSGRIDSAIPSKYLQLLCRRITNARNDVFIAPLQLDAGRWASRPTHALQCKLKACLCR
jgi:MFS-type transporter involved in bile tolerance (Atg22 family)